MFQLFSFPSAEVRIIDLAKIRSKEYDKSVFAHTLTRLYMLDIKIVFRTAIQTHHFPNSGVVHHLQVIFQLIQISQMIMDINHRILDRKSTRLNSSHVAISYAVFCLKKKKKSHTQ